MFQFLTVELYDLFPVQAKPTKLYCLNWGKTIHLQPFLQPRGSVEFQFVADSVTNGPGNVGRLFKVIQNIGSQDIENSLQT